MRKAFAEALVELAERDGRVVLLTGDLGFTVLEPFAERFPGRFWNVGVAEQNMVGVATGLAEAGYVPFVYSIATFASMRPYEFVRNGPALHGLPVRLVGVGGGFDYGNNGITHYALEDVGLMRLQPGMTVLVPADDDQTRAALAATAALAAPAYLRVGREGPPIRGLDGRFELGRAAFIGDGGDVLIAALGPLAREAVAAAESLAAEGIEATVAVVSSFNAGSFDDLADALARIPLVLTVEGHYVTGGLGTSIAELIAERGLDCRLVRHGVRALTPGQSGGQDFLHEQHALTAKALVRTAARAFQLAAR